MSIKERIKIFDDNTAIIFQNNYDAWQFSMYIKTDGAVELTQEYSLWEGLRSKPNMVDNIFNPSSSFSG
jgi:hypothetical protein